MNIEKLEKHIFNRIQGIYFLFNNDQLCYIGQSIDIMTRICRHAQDKEFTHYSYIECSVAELNTLEKKIINKYLPLLNKCLNKKYKEKLKTIPSIRVYNKEKHRARIYYSSFDVKKKYPHLKLDDIEPIFNKNTLPKARYEDELLIIH